MIDNQKTNPIDTAMGDSPVKHIPADYYPKNCGFWFTIPDGRDKGKKMFFRDHMIGEGPPESIIVLVHGNPECSYSFRKIIHKLDSSVIKPCRVIAMDHIGFGLSDQASFQMVEMDHAENLLKMIHFRDFQNVTLVVHDWGGPIGIGAFLKEPQRVSNLVILNTSVFPMPGRGYTYHKNYPIPHIPWVKFPSFFPDRFWGSVAGYTIYRSRAGALRMLLGSLIYIALSEMGLKLWKEKNARLIYKEQFHSRTNTRSSKHLVRQTEFWGSGNQYRDPLLDDRDTREFYNQIQQKLKAKWGPDGKDIGVRALFGTWDPLGKDEVIGQWLRNLPQLKGKVRTFKDVGHFVNIEKPDDIAAAVIDVAELN